MKRIFFNAGAFIAGTLFGIGVALASLTAFAEWVHAATYNTFFNNVEQGANSQSSPTLTIQGGVPVKTAEAPVTTSEAAPAPMTTPTVSPPAAATRGDSTSVAAAPFSPSTPNGARITLSG